MFLASRIREDYVRTGDPGHAIVAGGAASARVVVAAALPNLDIEGAGIQRQPRPAVARASAPVV